MTTTPGSEPEVEETKGEQLPPPPETIYVTELDPTSPEYQEAGKIRAEEDTMKAQKLLEDITKHTTTEKAREIIGDKYYCGPEKIEEFWGIKTTEVPPIPFSETVLKNAKENGLSLQYFPTIREQGMSEISPLDLQAMAEKHVAKLYPNRNTIPNEQYFTITPIEIGRDQHYETAAQARLMEELRKPVYFRSGWRLVGENKLSNPSDSSAHLQMESSSEAYFRMVNQQKMGIKITDASSLDGSIEGKWGHKFYHIWDPKTIYTTDEFESFKEGKKYRIHLGVKVTGYGGSFWNYIQPTVDSKDLGNTQIYLGE